MMDILINTYDTMAKILLVEDEVNIASFIERGLREFGHEVYVDRETNPSIWLSGAEIWS